MKLNLLRGTYALAIQALFILAWMCSLIFVGRFLPMYLLLGLLGVLCLWDNRRTAPVHAGVQGLLLLVSAGFSAATICLNLSVFEPLYALLSISNMAMSLLGGTFVNYHILLRVFGNRREDTAIDGAVCAQVSAVFLWLLILIPTDSRYSVYLFCAVAGILCMGHNHRRTEPLGKNLKKGLAVFAGLFALAVVLANYPLFTPLLTLRALVSCGLALLGGFVVGYHVLLAMVIRLPMEGSLEARQHPGWVFAATLIPISVICLLYLFQSCYPGVLSQDSASTIAQIMGTQPYNNTMPFWHTITVQPFMRLGVSLFGTVDAGLALFLCVQILFMTACFGCVLVTLYQIGVPKWILGLVYFAYACIPYNIVFAVTLWKDVPFSGAAVLFATGLYRLTKHIGKSRRWNYAMLILGAIGFSLMRTNGWYAFLATALVMALLVGKKYRKLLVIMTLVLIFCWVLINPVLDALGVAETNLVEAFAIPMQQVARVIVEGRPLTAEETELLSSIFWVDRMAEVYDPLTVDPIKFQTFRYDKVGLIAENPAAYLKLYFQLGLKYPGDYLKAWIDETKGYWNSGYDYWIYSLIYVKEQHNPIANLFTSLFRFVNDTEVLKLFASVGLYTWGTIGCCFVNAVKKREEFLLSIPSLVLLAGLWIGTPVFCEFRYAYPVVLTLPLIACVTLYQKPDNG